ncbi:hypothetical protein [Amycolatopsis sp. CB00013]|uniref:hypothetical protein n=1 Tax=Amycolatopsis sp. CB00013 TaxID=1703945 RepID=UPI000959DEC9|nr:hypothetical protein [Amycolatopsis sp. CB00013]OKJ95665.1 hypothetical protein AMK34_21920 [Amycolatopsis sp. CB00013]
MSTPNATLLDLRAGAVGPPAGIGGRVVVLDDADALVEHAGIYLSLVGDDMVTAVVCVAVGEADTDNPLDGVVLSVPPALRHATVLWVGDQCGVDWAPDSGRLHTAGAGDALDDLVSALLVPELFDRVVAVSDKLAGPVTNPGIRLVSQAVDPAELAAARDAAVRSLCAENQLPSHDLAAKIRQLDATQDPDGAALSGAVARAGAEAKLRLDHVETLARALTTATALFGSGSPAADLLEQAVWAGQAAENYRRHLAELVNRMDSHLQVGHPPVESVLELGVRTPPEARRHEIAEGLRQAIKTRIDEGASLPALAQETRFASENSRPQGCTTAIEEFERHGQLSLALPPAPRWPLPPAVFPFVFLSCAVLAAARAGWPGLLAGALLAVMWTAVGRLMVHRWPGHESRSVVVSTYAVTALLGAGVGALVSRVQADRLAMPPLATDVVTVLTVLGSVAVVLLGWRTNTRRWCAELPVAVLRYRLDELTRLTERAVVSEWQPMRRRQAIASAAAEVSRGLEEVAETLAKAQSSLATTVKEDPAARLRPVPAELYDVVHGDLADLCRTALAPAWPAAEATLRTPPGGYSQRLESLLDEYRTHIEGPGLMMAPRFSRASASRDALMARKWAEVPEALEALRARVDGDMTQLCRGGQLSYLSTTAEPALVRFAPAQLRQVLEHDVAHQRLVTDPGIEWSAGELVGSLRLLPLRPESVRQGIGGGH